MTTRRPIPARAQAPAVRCAIYTRKSSEEGLEQEFNSLDAQRESGENYIASQAGEGWRCLPDRYDDGGFTVGNMERPGVKRLLADIEAGKMERVGVVKVDRLSRALLYCCRLIGAVAKHNVTQCAHDGDLGSGQAVEDRLRKAHDDDRRNQKDDRDHRD